jgi:hypothetical protein
LSIVAETDASDVLMSLQEGREPDDWDWNLEVGL